MDLRFQLILRLELMSYSTLFYQNGGSATDKDGNVKLATPENIETLEYTQKI